MLIEPCKVLNTMLFDASSVRHNPMFLIGFFVFSVLGHFSLLLANCKF